ncbi:hypothetical protein SynBIOSU31_00060 [Synechococcus sp. BIOS-U3-1]|nr:hypothetical protein SynBIOSU31_00060 [Synechococcus sp. BIOS-U3-1]
MSTSNLKWHQKSVGSFHKTNAKKNQINAMSDSEVSHCSRKVKEIWPVI